jgi:hypothetical protein
LADVETADVEMADVEMADVETADLKVGTTPGSSAGLQASFAACCRSSVCDVMSRICATVASPNFSCTNLR